MMSGPAGRPDTDAIWGLVPAERQADVRAACASTFGRRAPTRLTAVAGGGSAVAYRMEIDARNYLLRLEGPPGGIRDPHRSYACMQLAADAGVAPRVHYADPDAGVAIIDFIAERPLAEHPGGQAGLVVALASLFGRLQRTSDFPTFLDYPSVIGHMLDFVRNAQLLRPGLLDPHLEAFERLRAAYPWNANHTTASHNDPNPRNILFDGKRLWLIDWETAFQNDRFVDIAALANAFCPTPELEQQLLHAWLGRSPDNESRIRLTLMRPLVRLYYAALILCGLVVEPALPPEPDLIAPSSADLRRAIAEGRLGGDAPQARMEFAKILLAQVLDDVRAPDVRAAAAARDAV